MTDIQKLALKDTAKTMSIILLLVAVLFAITFFVPLIVIVFVMSAALFVLGAVMVYEHHVFNHSRKIK